MKWKEIKELNWGSRGKTGTKPLKVQKLVDLKTSHLLNILITQGQISVDYKLAIKKIILRRVKKK